MAGARPIDVTSVQIVTPPQHGTATVDLVTGRVLYTPAVGFYTTDSWQYIVCATGLPRACSAPATVSVAIDAVAPRFLPIVANATGCTPVAINVLAQAVVGAQGMNASSLFVVTLPRRGTATVLNGVVYYVAECGFVGADSFFVAACDLSTPRALCTNGTVGERTQQPLCVCVRANLDAAVNVLPALPNQPPVTPDVFFTIDSCTTFNILSSVTDVDGTVDPSSLRAIVSATTRGCAHVLPGGFIRFTPDADYLGQTCFSYRVCDNLGLCAEGKVFVTVVPVTRAALQVNFLF